MSDAQIALGAAESAAASASAAATSATYAADQIGQLDDYADSASAAATAAAASATSAAASAELASSGGSSSLTVVSGGTVNLDNTKPDGFLIGYKVTATTTIEDMSFAAGSYIFERDSTVGAGWTYRTLDTATALTVPADVTAPTAPSLSVDNSSQTQLVATFSGGTDAVGVTQYRSRIDAGSWTVGASPRTFTGLTASTSYTIDAQAGDAAGNWSTSTTWTGSTAAPLTYRAKVTALAPTHYLALDSNTTDTGSSPATWTPTSVTYGTDLNEGGTGSAVMTNAAAKITGPTGAGSGISGCSTFTIYAIATGNPSATRRLYHRASGSVISIGDGTNRIVANVTGLTAVASAASSVPTTGTHRFGIRYNGTHLSVWLNGVKLNEAAITGSVTEVATNALYLGSDGAVSHGGTIDGVAIWRNVALSDANMLAVGTP